MVEPESLLNYQYQLLVFNFDNGLTWLRDVGGMNATDRQEIITAFQNGTLATLARSGSKVLSRPVNRLHLQIVAGQKSQPIGHNFFVNANGFLIANLPWAVQFDDLLKTRGGYGIDFIAKSKNLIGKDRLLTRLTEKPDQQLT